ALDGLNEAGTQQWNQHEIHSVQATKDSAVAAPNYRVLPAEEFAGKGVTVKVRIPRGRHAWAERTVVGIVGVLSSVFSVAHQIESDGRIVDLSLQCSVLAEVQIGNGIDNLISLVDEFNLFPVLFDRRHLERPSQTVGEREGLFHVPSVTEIEVVKRDCALVECRGEWRIQSEIGTTSGVSNLRNGNQTESRGVIAGPAGGRADIGCKSGQIDTGSGAGSGSQLVDGLIVDAATIVSTLVPVEVMLVGSSKLKQMGAFQSGDIVTEHLIM